MNAHNTGAIAGFFAPSFVLRGKDGHVTKLEQYLEGVTDALQSMPDWGQSLRIERFVIRGRDVELMTATVDSFTESPGTKQHVRRHTRETWRKIRSRRLLVRIQQL